MQLDVASSDVADIGTYQIVLTVRLTNYTSVTLHLTSFQIKITADCRSDTFQNFLWSQNDVQSLPQFDRTIGDADLDVAIKTHSNTYSVDCTMKYSLFEVTDPSGANTEAPLTLTSNFVLDSSALPTYLRVKTTIAETALDMTTVNVRVKVRSEGSGTGNVSSYSSILLSVQFLHPCRNATINSQTIADMTNQVDITTADTQTVPAFGLTPSGLSCGD